MAFVPLIHYTLKISSRNYNSLSPCDSSALSFSLSLFPFPICHSDDGMGRNAKSEMMCPRFPSPLQLEHPIPSLKEALEKVRRVIYHAQI